MRRFSLTLAVFIAAAAFVTQVRGVSAVCKSQVAARTPKPAYSKEVKELLDRFDAFQKAANTLQADFKQENHSSLLLAPAVLAGNLSLSKPSSIENSRSKPTVER